MRRFVFLCLILICGCRIVDKNTIEPEFAIKHNLDSMYVYRIDGQDDAILTKIRKFDDNGRVSFMSEKIPGSYIFNYYFTYDSSGNQIQQITYDKDSLITVLAKRYFSNNKYMGVRVFLNIKSLADTLTISDQVFLRYSSKFDTAYVYKVTKNLEDTIVKLHHIKVFNDLTNKALEIDFADSSNISDTTFYQYDKLGALKMIINADGSKVVYTKKGFFEFEEKHYNDKNQFYKRVIKKYSKSNLWKKELVYWHWQDRTVMKKINGEKIYTDTTVLDYSVKPTIYLYKYTKRKQ